mgnify:CR=1 FL=1
MKRLPVKYIRDKAKAAYEKQSECKICGTDQNLELHHFAGLTDLFNRWIRRKKLKIETTDDILEHREDFIAEHTKELYEDVVTLCKTHHGKLHEYFGKAPVLSSAKLQARWVEKQRGKHLG